MQRNETHNTATNTAGNATGTAGKRNFAARIGRWSALHRKTAIVGWIAFVVLAFAAGQMTGQKTMSDVDNLNGESAQAEQAILDAGLDPPPAESVLVKSNTLKYGDRAFNAAVDDVANRVGKLPEVRNVVAPAAGAGSVSADKHAALVQSELTGDKDDAADTVVPVLAQVDAARKAHPAVTVGQFGDGSVDKELNGAFADDLAKARNLSLPVTLLILLFAFGALAAAGVPVLLAITAVMATIGLIAIPSQIMPVDESISEVILLIGMAVGVDYSLFYIKRQREERAAGRSNQAAIEAAAATSGRAVLVSGVTVIAAMAGMFLTGSKTFGSFGLGTSMVVAIAMIGSLTVLPAMMSVLGDRIDKGRVPFLGKRRQARAARGDHGGFWSAITERVLRRPVVSAVLATAVLVALAIPATTLKIQDEGISDFPQSFQTIKTYNDVQAVFPSENLTANVVYQADNVRSGPSKAAITAFTDKVSKTAGLYPVSEVRYSKDNTTVELAVPLVNSKSQADSEREIGILRDTVVPATLGKVAGADINVGGGPAASKDFKSMMSKRAPLVFIFVLGFAFMLMLVTFRSIVIPIKAIILNLLSVAASYGVLVLVFQRGWGESLLGFTSNGAIASWLPMFLFVILFGLSMDYHVFILSRVREAFDGGMSTEEAVADGIKSTAGVVTSAAFVMVAVFSIFATLSMLSMKQMGVGLAAAILIDATIVRAVLLPATMKLLGDYNWYMPKSLNWMPKLQAEGSTEANVTTVPEPAVA